jgi:hypothetical protein
MLRHLRQIAAWLLLALVGAARPGRPRLGTERLESRDCPSALDDGGGYVRFDNGARVSAFGPGWTGELNVVQGKTEVLVGGDLGAGPNLARFDLGGNRIVPDVYVGKHPERREGTRAVHRRGAGSGRRAPPVVVHARRIPSRRSPRGPVG